MTCSEFIESFSDYIDETGPEELRAEAQRHLGACPRCQRYESIYRRGCSVLSADSVEVDDHFRDRLQHRLYHVDDEKALARSSAGYHPVVMIVGTAALVAGLLGVPVVFGPDPEVELSPIVVSAPEKRDLGLKIPLPSLLPASLSPAALELDGYDLWHRPADLFYDYAPVRARYRDASTSRLGLQ